jgi:cell division protein FtsB
MATARKQVREPEQKRRHFRIRPAYIVLLVLMGLFAFKFVEKTRELQQLTREANALRVANQQTLADSQRLRNAIAYYKTPPYVEDQARRIFGYKRPGDSIIVSTPHYQKAAARPGPRITVPPQPTWKQWWSSFFQ